MGSRPANADGGSDWGGLCREGEAPPRGKSQAVSAVEGVLAERSGL